MLPIFLAAFKLNGTKYKEKRNPPESEMHKLIMTKLEVNFAAKLPIIKNGIPVQIKKVTANNTNAITISIKFFLNTSA